MGLSIKRCSGHAKRRNDGTVTLAPSGRYVRRTVVGIGETCQYTATLTRSFTGNTGCRLYALMRIGKHPGTAEIDLKTRTGLLSVHKLMVKGRERS